MAAFDTDDNLAALLSLVEDCDLAAARKALKRSHGNVGRAVALIFEWRGQAPSSSASSRAPVAVSADRTIGDAIHIVTDSLDCTGQESVWTSFLADNLRCLTDRSAQVHEILRRHGWTGAGFERPPDRSLLLDDLHNAPTKGPAPLPAGGVIDLDIDVEEAIPRPAAASAAGPLASAPEVPFVEDVSVDVDQDDGFAMLQEDIWMDSVGDEPASQRRHRRRLPRSSSCSPAPAMPPTQRSQRSRSRSRLRRDLDAEAVFEDIFGSASGGGGAASSSSGTAPVGVLREARSRTPPRAAGPERPQPQPPLGGRAAAGVVAGGDEAQEMQEVQSLQVTLKGAGGEYYEASTHHGRPVYFKLPDGQPDSATTPPNLHCIYYWDEASAKVQMPREGNAEYTGWWCGRHIGGEEVNAFHRGRRDVGFPPTHNWRHPWSGEVDKNMRVSVKAKGDFLKMGAGSWAAVPGTGESAKEAFGIDPYALSLKGGKTDSLPTQSKGDLHQVAQTVHQVVQTIRTGECDEFARFGDQVLVRKQVLLDMMRELKDHVRYRPSSLRFSARVRFSDQPPEECTGKIPDRPFPLMDNGEDDVAPQPPHFTEHNLRPEQLRSLSWMLAREGRRRDVHVDGARVLGEAGERGDDAGAFQVQWRRYTIRPNVPDRLADYQLAELKVGEVVNVRWLEVHTWSAQVLRRVREGLYRVKWLRWDGPDQEQDVSIRDIIRFKAWSPLVFEVMATATYNVYGGILADKIGYGKTATTIGLIDSTVPRSPPKPPARDQHNFIPAKGTLIIVPSNLLEQWQTEIAKFVYGGKALHGSLRSGWSSKDCPLRVYTMQDVRQMKAVTAADLAETADIVLCTYRLLYSPQYAERRRTLARGPAVEGNVGLSGAALLRALVSVTSKLVQGRASVAKKVRGDETTNTWRNLEFPLLEMFFWNRVVFDEFHELESFESQQQTTLQHLRAQYRWGLTGTPPVDNVAGVIFMSSLFRIDLPGKLTIVNKVPDLASWEADRWCAEQAAQFLGSYVRQNTAQLPHIALEEHVVLVRHTTAERALYLGQVHDAPDLASPDAFATDENIKALERLLQLCSHFHAFADGAGDAGAECTRIVDTKLKRVKKARARLAQWCRVFLLLEKKVQKEHRSDAKLLAWRKQIHEACEQLRSAGREDTAPAAAAAEMKALLQDLAAEADSDRLACLEGLRVREGPLPALLGPPRPPPLGGHPAAQWAALQATPRDQGTLHALAQYACDEQLKGLKELRDAMSSLGFFQKMVRALADDSTPEARTCSVCLEDDVPLEKLAITPCAHAFCIDCLKMTVQQFKHCSICRQTLSLKDIRPISRELEKCGKVEADTPSSSSSSSAAPPVAPPPSGQAASPAAQKVDDRFRCYGTKLAAVVAKLQELRAADPEAKVILFVQFDDLKRKVAAALTEFGIPNAQLQGSPAQRSRIIRDWQNNVKSSTFVLLLSLASSASGANLTAASHVVFLHPMLAPTPARAVGYELQAIGRARRHGQRRSVVHVWRFVTADTIEQDITERHQAALWARESAREEAFAAAPPADPPAPPPAA